MSRTLSSLCHELDHLQIPKLDHLKITNSIIWIQPTHDHELFHLTVTNSIIYWSQTLSSQDHELYYLNTTNPLPRTLSSHCHELYLLQITNSIIRGSRTLPHGKAARRLGKKKMVNVGVCVCVCVCVCACVCVYLCASVSQSESWLKTCRREWEWRYLWEILNTYYILAISVGNIQYIFTNRSHPIAGYFTWYGATGRPLWCLIFVGHFPQKSPIMNGSFASSSWKYPIYIARYAVATYG